MKNGVVGRTTDGFFRYQGWPTVARDEKGVLYAVSSGHRLGHVCPFGKNLLYISHDDGESWLGPIIANDDYMDDRDAGLVAWGDGQLLLSWFVHPREFYKGREGKNASEKEEDKRLLVKCYFYLLSAGISALNKMGHETIHDWTSKSPDRVYAWKVNDEPTVSAYIRIKAGKSKAGRGEYKRALPFFTMRFDNLDSALGILMSIDDMLESVQKGKLIMDGAPEFGAQIGEYMLMVGAYAK